MIAEFQNGWEAQWPSAYTENFEVYEKQNGLSEKQVVERCINPFAKKDGHALEIGCGSGNAWLKKHLAKRFMLATGVDVIRREWVMSDDTPANVSYIRVAPDDYSLSMIENDTIDFVWSFGCLGHLPRTAVRAYVNSAFRVIRPGGDAVFEFFATTRRFPDTKTQDAGTNLGEPGTFFLGESEPEQIVGCAGFAFTTDLFPKSKVVILSAHKAI